MKKVGILGGTFNPIHNAHLNIAKEAMSQYDLDEVWFMPAGNPPHKEVSQAVTAKERAKMVQLAIEEEPKFRLCDIEINKKEPCYSYQTLKELHHQYKDDIHFYFIIGEDSFYQFDQWVKPHKIVKYADILVAKRPHSKQGLHISFKEKKKELQELFGDCFFEIKVEKMDVSSSEIREALEQKKDLSNVIPTNVAVYIKEHQLYEQQYTMQMIHDIKKQLKKVLKKERYEHTIGVMHCAGNMAFHYRYPYEKAMLAGLLHDCAKCLSDEERLDICKKEKIPVSKVEKANPHLLHGKVGAFLAKSIYQIDDAEIHHAIAVHTTGCVSMSLLDKIIYIADYIEPNRDKAPRLAEIRHMAYHDIDQCMYMILSDSMDYLSKHPETLDETTREAFAYYNQLCKERI